MDEKRKEMQGKKKVVRKVPWYGYLALIGTILFLSGVFQYASGPLKAFDFLNAVGDFGNMGEITEGTGVLASNFKGIGGTGAKDAFLLALTIAPAIIAAFGVVEICKEFDGLMAGEKLLTPILKPILGIPGSAGIALVTSLTSSDAGAALTSSLYSDGYLTDKERLIFTVFQFSSPTLVLNFFAVGAAALSSYIGKYLNIAFLVILFFKIFGAFMSRIYIRQIEKKGGTI